MIYPTNQQFAPERCTIGRRVFLGALTVGSIGSIWSIPIDATNAAAETAQNRGKALYRLSEDVKAFYRVNRYP